MVVKRQRRVIFRTQSLCIYWYRFSGTQQGLGKMSPWCWELTGNTRHQSLSFMIGLTCCHSVSLHTQLLSSVFKSTWLWESPPLTLSPPPPCCLSCGETHKQYTACLRFLFMIWTNHLMVDISALTQRECGRFFFFGLEFAETSQNTMQ